MPAINEQQLIHQIKELSKTCALESLQRPGSKDPAYEFGLAVGVVKGISMVEELITKLLHGDEPSERQRSKSSNGYQA